MLQVDDAIEKRFHPDEKTVTEINMNDAEAMNAYINAAPLATPNKDLILNMDDKINPLFFDAIKDTSQFDTQFIAIR